MSPTDSGPASDGGFSFEVQESSVEVTRGERARAFYEEYIYKPALVAWDDWRTRIGGLIILFYIGLATIGTAVYPAPEKNVVPFEVLGKNRVLAPFEDMRWPLGADQQGIDIMSQAIHATPEMLLMVLSGAVFATVVAVIVGTLAGYKGGTVDKAVTGFNDVMMAIPGLPLVMVVAFIWEPTNAAVIGVIIMINYWAGLARTIRSQVLTLREESYVEASRAMGVSTPRILVKDIIPSLMPFVMVNFAFAARYVVFASVGLYYLGVLPVSFANWGRQMDLAYNQYSALVGGGARHLIYVPLIFIAGLALGLVLLAQGLDRLFNPRVRTRLAGESESVDGEDDDVIATGGI